MAKGATKPALAVKTRLQPDPPHRQGAAGPHQLRRRASAVKGLTRAALVARGWHRQWLSSEQQTLFVEAARKEQANRCFRFPFPVDPMGKLAR
jgi:hypothetical protein